MNKEPCENKKKYTLASCGLLAPQSLDDLTSSIETTFNNSSSLSNRSLPSKTNKEKSKNNGTSTLLFPVSNLSYGVQKSSIYLSHTPFPYIYPSPPPPPPPHLPPFTSQPLSSPRSRSNDFSKKFGNISKKLRNFDVLKIVHVPSYNNKNNNNSSRKLSRDLTASSFSLSSASSLSFDEVKSISPVSRNALMFNSLKAATIDGNTLYKPDWNSTKDSNLSNIVSSNQMANSNNELRSKKQFDINEACILCGLPLNNLLIYDEIPHPEKVLEMKCGHNCHEKCLILEIGYSTTLGTASEIYSYFPICSKCGHGLRVMPYNQRMANELVSKAITLLPVEAASTAAGAVGMLGVALDASCDLISTPTSLVSHQLNSPFLNNSSAGLNLPQHRNRNIRDSHSTIPPPLSSANAPKKHKKKPSRGSSVSAISSIISSVSNSSPVVPYKNANDASSNSSLDSAISIKNVWCAEIPVYLLKSKFVNELQELSRRFQISNNSVSAFKLNDSFIESLGGLRLFDKFHIIHDKESHWAEAYCYLFHNTLVVLNLKAKTFDKIILSPLVRIEITSGTILVLKHDKSQLYFNCETSEILEKWSIAFNNGHSEFPSALITSTINEHQYDIMLDEIQTFNTKNNSITQIPKTPVSALSSTFGMNTATGSYSKLPQGVNAGFYESTITSLVFNRKPIKMMIILNQLTPSACSLISIKNILKSLLMVRIDICLIFASSGTLKMDSKVLHSLEINARNLTNTGDKFESLDKIDEYHNLLISLTPRNESSAPPFYCETLAQPDSLSRVCSNYVEKYTSFVDLEDIATVVLSGRPLCSLTELSTFKNCLIEIGTSSTEANSNDADQNTSINKLNVCKLANWDDAMEVICRFIGLEFDESDFESSASDEVDSDDDNGVEDNTTDKDKNKNDNRTVRSELQGAIDLDSTVSTMKPTENDKGTRWGSLFNEIDKAFEETKDLR